MEKPIEVQLDKSCFDLYLQWIDDCWTGISISDLHDVYARLAFVGLRRRYAAEVLMELQQQEA